MMPCDVHREAEDLAELAQKNVNGDSVEKSHQNRPRQKIRDEAQPQTACHDANDACQDGEHHRHGAKLVGRPTASGPKVAATSAQVAASGLTMRCRDVPSRQ